MPRPVQRCCPALGERNTRKDRPTAKRRPLDSGWIAPMLKAGRLAPCVLGTQLRCSALRFGVLLYLRSVFQVDLSKHPKTQPCPALPAQHGSNRGPRHCVGLAECPTERGRDQDRCKRAKQQEHERVVGGLRSLDGKARATHSLNQELPCGRTSGASEAARPEEGEAKEQR